MAIDMLSRRKATHMAEMMRALDIKPALDGEHLSYRRRLAALCRNSAEDAEHRAGATHRAALLREVARELEAMEDGGDTRVGPNTARGPEATTDQVATQHLRDRLIGLDRWIRDSGD